MSFKIEHRIGVRAPPETVWEILSDLQGWSAWNPLYTSVDGALKIGAKLSVNLVIPGNPPEVITPVILDWVPHMQLAWRLKAVGGLVKTLRYMEIEPLADGAASVFSHGESFEGLAADFMPKALRKQIKQGFIMMSQALQTEAHRRMGVELTEG